MSMHDDCGAMLQAQQVGEAVSKQIAVYHWVSASDKSAMQDLITQLSQGRTPEQRLVAVKALVIYGQAHKWLEPWMPVLLCTLRRDNDVMVSGAAFSHSACADQAAGWHRSFNRFFARFDD